MYQKGAQMARQSSSRRGVRRVIMLSLPGGDQGEWEQLESGGVEGARTRG